MKNSDEKYSLKNTESFNASLKNSVNEIMIKYSELVIYYFNFVFESIKNKKPNLITFIMIRGLDTITNVFLALLYYTKNIDIVNYYSQKAVYFYVEFTCQMSEEDKTYLRLSSKDAVIYVYKKTIFELNTKNTKENENIIENDNILLNNETDSMKNVNLYINLYKTFLYKIIRGNRLFDEKYINITKNIYNNLNSYNLEKSIVTSIVKLIDHLYFNVEDIDYFFEISVSLINKIIKSPNIIYKFEKKILSPEFNEYLTIYTSEKFINWLIKY
jgi:hypothetical protein